MTRLILSAQLAKKPWKNRQMLPDSRGSVKLFQSL
jgi:hypothetical protein